MIDLAGAVTKAINGVANGRCVSVAIRNRADALSWRVDYSDDATDSDKSAGAAFLSGLDAVSFELALLRSALRNRVDQDAEACRQQYITPGAGMTMMYQEKFSQAQAVDALGQATANALTLEERVAQYPTLAASVGIEAATLWDCAQLVIARYEAFAALSNVIEGKRLAGKLAISNASDAATAQAAYEAITWPSP